MQAAPLTVLALALLLALYLVLISTLTLPHAVIVAFMDSRQGVWRRFLAVNPRHRR